MNLRPEHEREQLDVNITPLIDVIFLLVLFFMFTSTFIEEAKVFQIELPKADAAQITKKANSYSIRVSISHSLTAIFTLKSCSSGNRNSLCDKSITPQQSMFGRKHVH